MAFPPPLGRGEDGEAGGTISRGRDQMCTKQVSASIPGIVQFAPQSSHSDTQLFLTPPF